MEPFLLGGDMIENVYEQESTYAELPARFEAGTQYVEGAVGLVAAVRYIEGIGFDEIRAQEKKLVTRAIEGMKKLPRKYGSGRERRPCGVYRGRRASP